MVTIVVNHFNQNSCKISPDVLLYLYAIRTTRSDYYYKPYKIVTSNLYGFFMYYIIHKQVPPLIH